MTTAREGLETVEPNERQLRYGHALFRSGQQSLYTMHRSSHWQIASGLQSSLPHRFTPWQLPAKARRSSGAGVVDPVDDVAVLDVRVVVLVLEAHTAV